MLTPMHRYSSRPANDINVWVLIVVSAIFLGLSPRLWASPLSRDARPGQPAPTVSFTQGLFWKITRTAVPASYVYGTMHLDDPRVTRLPPVANLAFAKSRILIAEVNLDKRGQEAYMRAGLLRPGQHLSKLMGPTLFAQLEAIAARYGAGRKSLDHMKPWLVTNLVGRPPPHSGVVLDELLQQRAADLGKPVAYLETMEELVRQLDTMPLAMQIAILRDTIEQHVAIANGQKTALQAYLDQNLQALMAVPDGSRQNDRVAQQFEDRMLYARNRHMVRRLQHHLRAGNAFVAVGALHLAGPEGLLAGLTQAGFKVERVENQD
jgi:hypothetical protein